MNRLIFATLLLMMTGFSTFADAAHIDRGGGMIYDSDLDITWYQNPNIRKYTFDGANDWASSLRLEGFNNWRLPLTSEMSHLYYGLGNIPGGGMLNKGPFLNIYVGLNWVVKLPWSYNDQGYVFDFGSGYPNNLDRSNGVTYASLAARDGDIVGPITLTVTKSGSGSGIITSNPSGIDCGATCSATFATGTNGTLAATPDDGSAFTGWSGACSGTSPICQMAMNGPNSVSANFMKTYQITAAAGINGTISPSGLLIAIATYGSSKTFTITPNVNCQISDVLVDGVSVGKVETYTFTDITGDHSIYAIFTGAKQLVAITVSGPQETMSTDATQTLTATARYSDNTTEVIVNPVWASLNEQLLTVSATGVVTAKAQGQTSVTASFGGMAGRMDITVGSSSVRQHYGNLILVAGGGAADSNTLRESTQYLSDLVYRRFKNRLFDDQDIYYFNPIPWHDIDGDGLGDGIVDDSQPTVAKFGLAITQWAAGQSTDGPLYIYLIDHGGIDRFEIFPGQIVTATQLKGYLDTFQAAANRPVSVMIEACKSGTFADDLILPGSNRMLVTSADNRDSYLNLAGRISFTQFFTDSLLTGDSIYHAYQKAKQKLMNVGMPYNLMQPQLTEGQSLLAQQTRIGGEFTIAGLAPDFTGQSPNTVIQANATPEFYAHLSDLTGLEAVWAVVVPPDYLVPTTGADFTAPQVTLPALPMIDSNQDGTFLFTYANFIYNGDYRITFYARNANGNVSVSSPTIVTVSGGADPFMRGDINGDREINLADVILSLRLIGGFPPAGQVINPRSDINNDGKIGLAEAIYLLQKVAEMR